MNPGALTVTGSPAPETAIKLLFSPAYHQEKGRVMKPLGEFLQMTEIRTLKEVAAVRERETVYELISVALLLLTMASSLLAFFHLRRKMIQPIVSLTGVAKRIVKRFFHGTGGCQFK